MASNNNRQLDVSIRKHTTLIDTDSEFHLVHGDLIRERISRRIEKTQNPLCCMFHFHDGDTILPDFSYGHGNDS